MTTFWKRFTIANLGGKIVNSDDIDIFFNIQTSTDSDADIAEITIFNLSDTTRDELERGQIVNLSSGYEGDYGTVFIGTVAQIEDEIDGADVTTLVTCTSDMKALINGYINKIYPADMKLVDIATDMIQTAGITNIQIDDSDVTTEVALGYTSETSIRDNLIQIAGNLGYTFTERRGSIFLIDPKSGIVEGFVLNSDSGLLNVRKVQQEDEAYDFEVTTLLIYRIDKGSIIKLDSSISGNKLCRVEECIFTSSDADHICEMKVKIL